MHDSGTREQFDTGAQRDTASDKPRPDLISPYSQLRVGEWLRKGAEKYDERNWEKGIPVSRCLASLCRHLLGYMVGDTTEDHLAAVRTNADFMLHFEEMVSRGLLPASLLDLPWYENGGQVPFTLGPEQGGLKRFWGIRIISFDGGLPEEWIHYHKVDTEKPTHLAPIENDPYIGYEQLWDSRAGALQAMEDQNWLSCDVFEWDGPEPIPFEEA